jgi:hypothetical protein
MLLETVKERITRRRALIITPFAFAGLIAISSRKGSTVVTAGVKAGEDPEVTIVPFNG